MESWNVIVHHLTRLRRPIARMLQPGLSRERIAALEAKLPFTLGRDLVALYSTTNGTPPNHRRRLSDVWIVPGYYLLSLEEAVSEYKQMRRAPQWQDSWFPIFANNAGDYYVVSRGRGAKRGVVGFMRGEPEHAVEYASVPAMFDTIAACLAEGAYHVERGSLEVDEDKQERIAERLNPGLAYWKTRRAEEAEAERSARGQELVEAADRMLLGAKKKPREAFEAYEKALELSDHYPYVYVNALAAMIAANAKRRLDPERVRRMLDRVLSRRALHADTYWNAACCWMILGETDRCIASLREAKRRGADMAKCLADPYFTPLADDPRFRALGRPKPRRGRDAGRA